MKSPCMNCPKAGCGSYHSQCEDYIAFQQKRKAANTGERAEKRRLNAYIQHGRKK